MVNFKDISRLVNSDEGKVFIVNESGELQCVILSAAQYEKTLLQKVANVSAEMQEVSNQVIDFNADNKDNAVIEPVQSPYQSAQRGFGTQANNISDTLKSRLTELKRDFGSSSGMESIDPGFNFENPNRSYQDL